MFRRRAACRRYAARDGLSALPTGCPAPRLPPAASHHRQWPPASAGTRPGAAHPCRPVPGSAWQPPHHICCCCQRRRQDGQTASGASSRLIWPRNRSICCGLAWRTQAFHSAPSEVSRIDTWRQGGPCGVAGRNGTGCWFGHDGGLFKGWGGDAQRIGRSRLHGRPLVTRTRYRTCLQTRCLH